MSRYSLTSLFIAMAAFAAGWGMRDSRIGPFDSMAAIVETCRLDDADCGVLVTFDGDDVAMFHATFRTDTGHWQGNPIGSTISGFIQGPGYCVVVTDREAFDRISDMRRELAWREKVDAPLWRKIAP